MCRVLCGVVSLVMLSSAAWSQPTAGAATHTFGASRPVPGQYIVVLRNDGRDAASLNYDLARQSGGQIIHSYTSAIRGFAARMSATAAAQLARNPAVAFVEQDQTISLSEAATVPPLVQSAASWGLDRIDQRALPLNSAYRFEYTGASVYAFVIDTGIRATHTDFGGRVNSGAGYSAFSDIWGTSDCNGHGTHVASTLGGGTYGVAKGVTLVPVRVLDCNGSGQYSAVIAGIDHVVRSGGLRPAVINMSLGGSKSSSVNAAVASAVNAGVVVVVAAGNSNANACNYSPASEPTAITVGATGNADARASYSNYGSCLDLFAPGSSITAAWYSSDSAVNTISGTSMAAPHVAGVAALLLAGGVASPGQVATALSNQATTGSVTTPGTGSPNRLLFSLASETITPAPVTQTVAISAITGRGVIVSSRSWAANATVTVKQHDGFNFGAVISNATVTGTFSPGGSASCITGSTGSCTLKSSSISRTYTTSTFTATGVSGSSLVYDGTKNAAVSLTIQRP